MKKQIIAAFSALACIGLLFSCSKSSNGTSQQNANILLVNASPGDSAARDFYFNNVKLNTQAVAYPSNTGYLPLAPGGYSVKITEVNTINTQATGNVNFAGGQHFSVFAYDTLLSGKIKVFATGDDLTAPAANMAKVRFFHLSPVPVAVDIYANDSLVFANRSYADNVSDNSKGAFISIGAGTYTVKLRLAGSNSNISPLLTLNNNVFEAGKIYTIFAKGTITGTGVNALGAEVIINK